MREINLNLDPTSQAQMFQIAAREAIEALEKAVGEFQSAHTGLERLGELENRIKVLEEARKKQIEINTRLLSQQEARKESTKIPVKEVKSFWPWK